MDYTEYKKQHDLFLDYKVSKRFEKLYAFKNIEWRKEQIQFESKIHMISFY